MTASMTSNRSYDYRSIRKALVAALNGHQANLGAWLDQNDERRRLAATGLKAIGDLSGYLELRLFESAAQLSAGRVERALSEAREVWKVIEGHAPYPAQALVLTQLAACAKARGDISAAARAARRAEAMLTAESGDATPAVLAVRSWLWRCLQGRAAASAVKKRLDRSVKIMGARVTDGMRTAFLESASPPHWALVHMRRWSGMHASDEPVPGVAG